MSAFGGPATLEPQPSLIPANENSHDLFSWETTYTLDSDFKESKLGHGNSLYDDFSYDHRFLITGKWYFRAGVEYERYDFDGTDNGSAGHRCGRNINFVIIAGEVHVVPPKKQCDPAINGPKRLIVNHTTQN